MTALKEVVANILGAAYEIKTIGVVKVYICEQESNNWDNSNVVGPAALVFHAKEKAYSIVVVNSEDNTLALSQELYDKFHYESHKDFLHTFEMEDCVAGLSFAHAAEAKEFLSAVKSAIGSSHATPAPPVPAPVPTPAPTPATTKPAPVPSKPALPPRPLIPPPPVTAPPSSTPAPPPPPTTPLPPPPPTNPLPPPPPIVAPPPARVEETPPPPPPLEEDTPISPRGGTPPPAATQATPPPADTKPKKKSVGLFKKMMDTVTNAITGNDVPEDFEVSDPRGFRHESHIGWDPERGFEIRNIPPEWRKLFAAAGIKKNELRDAETARFVMNVIGETVAGTGPTTSAPPPPPPAQTVPLTKNTAPAPPPPPPSGGPPPPPPPGKGPPPPPAAKAPVKAPATTPAASTGGGAGGGRDDLLKSIQLGKNLKHVEAGALPDLKNMGTGQSNNLVNTLASAMAMRRGHMHQEEEREETEEDNWSD